MDFVKLKVIEMMAYLKVLLSKKVLTKGSDLMKEKEMLNELRRAVVCTEVSLKLLHGCIHFHSALKPPIELLLHLLLQFPLLYSVLLHFHRHPLHKNYSLHSVSLSSQSLFFTSHILLRKSSIRKESSKDRESV